jgi:hypothetical protein
MFNDRIPFEHRQHTSSDTNMVVKEVPSISNSSYFATDGQLTSPSWCQAPDIFITVRNLGTTAMV